MEITQQKLEDTLKLGGAAISGRQLRELAKRGVIQKTAHGLYDDTNTLVALIRYYKSQHTEAGQAFAAARLKKMQADADIAVLERERILGTLVETEAVIRYFEPLFVAFRARILASSLTTQEQDEILNDIRGLKSRGFAKSAAEGK